MGSKLLRFLEADVIDTELFEEEAGEQSNRSPSDDSYLGCKHIFNLIWLIFENIIGYLLYKVDGT
jgi:hypothetical protein